MRPIRRLDREHSQLNLLSYVRAVVMGWPGKWPSKAVIALLAGLLVSTAVFSGCTPRVIVRSHPASDDPGIRYYRPKPYLKVEPAEVALEKNQTTIVPGVVRISLVYLPDFSEEYSIDVRSGLGIANVGIKLQDGWNLTEISQELDSQTDENVKAAASLLSAVGDVVPTAGLAPRAADVSFTVPARNVPIGLYESLIGRDARGCKRLYGFRYVGFVPFSNCPLDIGGQQSACCNDPQSGLYGLSFIGGQMVFLPLDEMATTPAAAAGGLPFEHGGLPKNNQTSAASPSAEPVRLPLAEDQLGRLEVQLRAALQESFDGIGEVRAQAETDRVRLSVQVPAGVPPLAIRQLAEDWLESALGKTMGFELELLPGS